MRKTAAELSGVADLAAMGAALSEAVAALQKATDWLVAALNKDPSGAAAGASAYLRLFGTAVGGYLLGRQALTAQARVAAGDGDDFYRAKLVTARFYAEQLLPQAAALVGPATAGADTLFALSPELLSA
jgi:hypothetical protein